MIPSSDKSMEKEKSCFYCVNGMTDVDYTDPALLRKFMSSFMKIMPRRRSFLCAKHQRKMARAIKRARTLGMVPYVPVHK